MHIALLVAAAASFTATVFAGPEIEALAQRVCRYNDKRPQCIGKVKPADNCMSRKDALVVADTFKSLIRGYTKEQAIAALTEDFVDYSSAVSIIINKGAGAPKDLAQPIFTNRTQFMQNHGKQKPIPFEVLDVWHTCDGTVSMRWITTRSAQGQPTEAAAIPVPGLVILETEPAEEGNVYNNRIHTIYSEFNTAAWLVNLGVLESKSAAKPVPSVTQEVASCVCGAPAGHWYHYGLFLLSVCHVSYVLATMVGSIRTRRQVPEQKQEQLQEQKQEMRYVDSDAGRIDSVVRDKGNGIALPPENMVVCLESSW